MDPSETHDLLLQPHDEARERRARSGEFMTLTTLARGMQSLREIPEALASFALLAVYFALLGGRVYSIDGFETYQQALSIVVDRSIHLRPFVFQNQTFSESLDSHREPR